LSATIADGILAIKMTKIEPANNIPLLLAQMENKLPQQHSKSLL